MVSIAVVGGGFGRVGAVTMLEQAGYQDVTGFERAPRVGGVWHRGPSLRRVEADQHGSGGGAGELGPAGLSLQPAGGGGLSR